ncbi:hypothetical protein Smic_75620 [Streptomyces microflavus]|uniref:Uncharacterized protein n=1 Tax=Streptomyces microflavus TaxID=1919 RepID=A0A7J0D2M0_STRMI|nr:hypothetical protein Smic_75620 [Streptomyces microflavus]
MGYDRRAHGVRGEGDQDDEGGLVGEGGEAGAQDGGAVGAEDGEEGAEGTGVVGGQRRAPPGGRGLGWCHAACSSWAGRPAATSEA